MGKKIIFGICILLLLINGCNEEPNIAYNNESNVFCGNNELLLSDGICMGDTEYFTGSTNLRNVTASITVDCSLPEVTNETVEIVYGEAIYDNTNYIEITFVEFCKRLAYNS